MNPLKKAGLEGAQDAEEFIHDASMGDLIASVSEGHLKPDEVLLNAIGVEAVGRLFGVEAYNSRGSMSASLRLALCRYNEAWIKTVKAAIK